MSVAFFSAEPMKETILRASSERNSRIRPVEIIAVLLVFFIEGVSSSTPRIYCQAAGCTNGFFHMTRGIGNK